jgi:hypothetical protein
MDSSRLMGELGFEALDPWPANVEFVPTHGQWHYERGPEVGSPELLAQILYKNPSLRAN